MLKSEKHRIPRLKSQYEVKGEPDLVASTLMLRGLSGEITPGAEWFSFLTLEFNVDLHKVFISEPFKTDDIERHFQHAYGVRLEEIKVCKRL